jgi:hypothetical protein
VCVCASVCVRTAFLLSALGNKATDTYVADMNIIILITIIYIYTYTRYIIHVNKYLSGGSYVARTKWRTFFFLGSISYFLLSPQTHFKNRHTRPPPPPHTHAQTHLLNKTLDNEDENRGVALRQLHFVTTAAPALHFRSSFARRPRPCLTAGTAACQCQALLFRERSGFSV